MATAKNGDKVKVHYTGTFEDGEQFDSSIGKEPLEFELGAGMMIPGFEKGVVGMEQGEKKKLVLPPEEAYGLYNEEYVVKVGRDKLPPDLNPELNMYMEMQMPNGDPVTVMVIAMDDETLTLDANAPLAGKTLTFEIELLGILKK
ncbi:MAG: peptidylprolyl isomerase [Candidatus Kapaibacteriales bacterium]